MSESVSVPQWIAEIKQPDGSLLAFRNIYLEWDRQSDVVHIDGCMTARGLRELADYIEREIVRD